MDSSIGSVAPWTDAGWSASVAMAAVCCLLLRVGSNTVYSLLMIKCWLVCFGFVDKV